MCDFANRMGICANRTGKLQIAACFLQIGYLRKNHSQIEWLFLQIEHENLQIESRLKEVYRHLYRK
ncbi:hypothetical protein BK139_12925 [Paenibacillus sp. FSL R5-0490]|nr:hypothetical protein BK139_12925 [Paenibacillus sp. FSL R5-0490]